MLEHLRDILRSDEVNIEHNGLQNINRRIWLGYGGDSGLTIDSTEGEGFTIAAVETACTGCGLCADICTSKAVSFGAPDSADAWLSGRPVVKLAVKGRRRASAWEGIVERSFTSGYFNR